MHNNNTICSQAASQLSIPYMYDNSTEDDNVSIPYLVTMEKRLTGMMHCASFSGMEQFGSGGRGTVNCVTLPVIFKFFLVIS
jgi:hypothetical protein